jgi:NAD(P)-dependent dehydrogenase (short-subunit alcohol dehydrogenase family)
MAADPGLAGQVAVVTGAAAGIGRGLAEALARSGVSVVMADRAAERLAQAETDLAGWGATVASFVVDVQADGAPQRLVEAALERFGRLDIFVNNVAARVNKPSLDLTKDDWDAVLDTNLKVPFLCAQAAARAMGERGGSIVNISSQLGFEARPGRASYCVSKAGLNMLTRVLALEWAPRGIRVNAIAPAYIPTESSDPYPSAPEREAELLATIPLGRVGRPEDVAGALLYLVSPSASWVTGHILVVDGGWLAR